MDHAADPNLRIAELEAVLQRLRESEEHFRRLAEISQDMIFIINQEGVVEYVNPHAAQRLKARPENIIGCRMSVLFPPDVAQRQADNLQKVLTHHEPLYVEAPTRLGDQDCWLGTWIIPYYDRRGQVTAVMGAARDITERIRIEDDLRQAKDYAEKLIETANVIVIGLDMQANIRVFNAAAEEITGYKAEEVVGKNWFDIFVPRQRYPDVWEVFSQFSEGVVVKKNENPILTRSGEERIISWQNSIMQNRLMTGLISFGMDVTERRRAEQVQAALYRISAGTQTAQSLEELYSLIHQVIMDIMPTRNFYIGLYDETVDLIHFPFHWDEKDPDWPPHRLDDSLTSYVLRTGRAVLLDAAGLQRLEAQGEIAPLGPLPVDWLGVPLKTKAGTIGVMVVQSYDESCRLSERHKDVLVFMSNQVAMAIEHKQAETDLAESEARYRTLVELSPDAIAVHQRGSLVFVNQAAVALMGAKSAEDLLGMHISQVLDDNYRGRVLRRVREAFENNTPLPLMEEKFLRLDGSSLDVEVAATPVNFHGEPVMQVIIRDIGMRKKQEEQLKQASAELALAYDATLAGWSKALELREQETAGHSQRVVDLTLRLAQKLGVEEHRLLHIRRGALLHDIGKMGVPDSILLKPGPLSEDEWVIMRQHPVYACEMLKEISYLEQALEIPCCHHERWDGSGYPDGLRGEDIPLAARIFAVADVYDALTSARPYRPAWPEVDARNYLRQHRGTLFEPRVVDALWDLV